MKPTIERILQNQLNHIHAEVIMSAYTESSPGWTAKKSEPGFYRFSYTVKGQAWLDIQNKSYTVKPGMLFFLPAGTLQSFGTEGDETFGRYWCHFRLELSDIGFIQSLQLPPYVYVQDEQMMEQLFTKMITYQQGTSVTRELRMKAVMLELLAVYLDESHVQQHMLSDSGFAVKWNEVLAYIEANLHANIQIEELARFAFLHPNYFITSFKSKMGCSPIQYVTNRRIANARQLLSETSLPVSEVAKRVGMQNHYLSRLFKRCTGITPVQYRRIARLGIGNLTDYTATRDEKEDS
ncbi:AraC family transcriptional regulator [Paenibacillus alkaliterrae]|uniref:AraC family transcriptional regulator n=1 Tax=Paenibacillus alkaliterrae TaxID=320909 RepID=UPI001F45FE65|nr:AraC family transcriptional regulator [Paenibacillus alkaliterrae]MCF2937739.1 AraC family transcriptional regulator [Paenibacillus alkaliterrae]